MKTMMLFQAIRYPLFIIFFLITRTVGGMRKVYVCRAPTCAMNSEGRIYSHTHMKTLLKIHLLRRKQPLCPSESPKFGAIFCLSQVN